MSSKSLVYKQKILKSLKSPGFLMTTRRGTLYQLTPFNAMPLNLNNLIVSQSDFQHSNKMFDAMIEKGLSFKQFLGILPPEQNQTLIYLTPVDYYKEKISLEATSKPNTVRLFSNRGGYIEVTDDEYYNISSKMQPDIIVSLTEVPSGFGKKSSKRSVEKTLSFLDKAISIFKKGAKSDTMVFASIEGGALDEWRQESMKQSLQKNIDGIVLHGIEGDSSSLLEKYRQIKVCMEALGENKDTLFSVYSSKGSPSDIIIGVIEGVDFFEVDFPNQLAKNHLALAFDFENLNYQNASGEQQVVEGGEQQVAEGGSKAIPTNEEIVDLLVDKQPKTIDLQQYDKLKEELNGFVEGCECYACKNHTKAYVAHLVKCHELTGTILTTIHNVHQYNLFFAELQKAASTNSISSFCVNFIEKNFI